MSEKWWPRPTAGDIVWCRFPEDFPPVNTGPKPRPALVVTVFEDHQPQFWVQVVYGTSQRTNELYAGEFAIRQVNHFAAFEASGLSADTKFNFAEIVDLSYNSTWFTVPPAAPFGQCPQLGTLHPSLVRAAAAAYAAKSKTKR
jgi:hypothetical protein